MPEWLYAHSLLQNVFSFLEVKQQILFGSCIADSKVVKSLTMKAKKTLISIVIFLRYTRNKMKRLFQYTEHPIKCRPHQSISDLFNEYKSLHKPVFREIMPYTPRRHNYYYFDLTNFNQLVVSDLHIGFVNKTVSPIMIELEIGGHRMHKTFDFIRNNVLCNGLITLKQHDDMLLYPVWLGSDFGYPGNFWHYNCIRIFITSEEPIKLFGNVREYVPSEVTTGDFLMTVCSDKHKFIKGVNRIVLYDMTFMFGLFFHGPDVSKIHRIQIIKRPCLEKKDPDILYDQKFSTFPCRLLVKENGVWLSDINGGKWNQAGMISNTFTNYTYELLIYTTQNEQDLEIHVVQYRRNYVRAITGMFGLVFSA